MKKRVYAFTILIASALNLYKPHAFVQAQSNSGFDMNRGGSGPLTDPNQAYGLLGSLISTLFTIIIFGGALTAFVFLILGAYQWITARSGDGARQGRMTMIYAIGGLILMAFVYVFIFYFNQILPAANLPPDCTSNPNGPC